MLFRQATQLGQKRRRGRHQAAERMQHPAVGDAEQRDDDGEEAGGRAGERDRVMDYFPKLRERRHRRSDT